MTVSEEMKELLKQKREIDKRIRELKNGDIQIGSVRFKVDEKENEYPYQIAALCSYMAWQGNSYEKVESKRWAPFIRARTRLEAADELNAIIKDLDELHQQIRQGIQYK